MASTDKNFKSKEDDHWAYALELAFSGALPMVLNTVTKLDVFEIIAKAGHGAQLSPSQIVSQMPSENPEAPLVLDRMLRMLASFSVLTSSVIKDPSNHGAYLRVYGLGPVSKYFLKNEHGASLGPLLDLLQDKACTDMWHELGASVLEGGTAFNRAHDMPIFKYTSLNPKFNVKFNTGMLSHTKVVLDMVLKSYKGFESLETLVDVGGNIGSSLGLITSKYPNLKGINYDLPHVIETAPTYPGVQHIGGDMFESVPNGDAIFMKWILNDWDDDQCVKLLSNCYKSLPENGMVIAVDEILPVNPDDGWTTKDSTLVDLFMLALYHPGGRPRTEKSFQALATRAGFRGMRKMGVSTDLWVMEFYK